MKSAFYSREAGFMFRTGLGHPVLSSLWGDFENEFSAGFTVGTLSIHIMAVIFT
jgi:hypothetical protein